jgi:hypothetical protein
MQDVETIERLTRLETQHIELVRLMRESHDDMQLLKRDLHEVKDSLTKWKGVGAGIVITVSVLWSAFFAIYKVVGGK